jgi:membrane protease subunit (stomatin/prohibitin family)
MTGAYANAVQNAASNANGAANGFMGIGMMNMASGNAFGGVVAGNGAAPMQPQADAAVMAQTPVQPKPPVEAPATPAVNTEEVKEENNNSWKCTKCGAQNNGKFCTECGTKKEEAKFCTNCGNKLASDAKFCPECGTPAK